MRTRPCYTGANNQVERSGAVSEEEKPDDSEPTPERQAELRAAYEANVAAGKAPYEGVPIFTRGELSWVMRERDWSDELDEEGKAHVNLSGATLYAANLSGAILHFANLSGAILAEAKLSGASLRATRMNAETDLRGTMLDARTRLADIVWNGVPVTRLNWVDVDTLGDEWVAHQAKDVWGEPKDKATRLQDFQDAVLANRQVATLLRSQGLNEHADRFAYRAQLLQQQVLWRQRRLGAYLFSRLLDALMGYGYRLGRILFAYVAVVCGFAVLSLAGVALSGHTGGFRRRRLPSLRACKRFMGTPSATSSPHAAR